MDEFHILNEQEISWIIQKIGYLLKRELLSWSREGFVYLLSLSIRSRRYSDLFTPYYYWGTLEVVIKDPDGVVLVFISPYSEELARKLKADESFARKS